MTRARKYRVNVYTILHHYNWLLPNKSFAQRCPTCDIAAVAYKLWQKSRFCGRFRDAVQHLFDVHVNITLPDEMVT
jgi:hypothetical protein